MHQNWQGADVEKILFLCLTSIELVDSTFLC